MENLRKFFNYCNLVMGIAYFILLVFVGFSTNAVLLVLLLIFTVLHLGSSIGNLTSQSWAALANKICAWFGTVFWGIIFIVGIFQMGRVIMGLSRMGRGGAGGGFLGSLAFAVVFFSPIIFYYLVQAIANLKSEEA